jgi:hypothetical protein
MEKLMAVSLGYQRVVRKVEKWEIIKVAKLVVKLEVCLERKLGLQMAAKKVELMVVWMVALLVSLLDVEKVAVRAAKWD